MRQMCLGGSFLASSDCHVSIFSFFLLLIDVFEGTGSFVSPLNMSPMSIYIRTIHEML